MPQISLEVADVGGRTLPTPGGGALYLPQRRIRVWGRFGSELPIRQAVVDTGAPACILSEQIWNRFHARGDILWVAHAPASSSRQMLPRIDVHGGNYPYRLGRIRLQLLDLNNSLSPRDVLAICTEDVPTQTGDPPQLPNLLLLGLADVMHGRSLSLEASADGTQWTAALTEP